MKVEGRVLRGQGNGGQHRVEIIIVYYMCMWMCQNEIIILCKQKRKGGWAGWPCEFSLLQVEDKK